MSNEANEQAPAKKKGKGLITKSMIALALVGAGGGGAYALQQAGYLPGGGDHEEVDNRPQLILKGETDPYYVASEDDKDAGHEIPGEGGSKYRTAYFAFTDDFTSNLRGSTGLVQLSLAAATQHDGRVLMWLKKHELAVRSRILIVLADTPEEELLTPKGKELLQKRLVAAMNEELTEAEGFGGVSAVYFRSLLVQ